MQKIVLTKLFKVFFIAAFFLLLIFLNPAGFFSPFRGVVNAIFLPFQKVFYSLSINIEETRDFFGSIGQLKNENEKLLEDNKILRAENAMLLDMKNENELLRNQINLLPRDKYDLLAASVISQDPNGMGNWLEIDKGSNDGVVSGMSVIVSKGILVGRIQDVGINSSKIMLLTNSKNTISVMTLQNSTKGLVRGEYGLGIILDMALQTDVLTIGDDVVTSGIGGEIPRGLYVGSLREIHASSDHLFQQAVIESPVVFSKLQTVFIVKKSK